MWELPKWNTKSQNYKRAKFDSIKFFNLQKKNAISHDTNNKLQNIMAAHMTKGKFFYWEKEELYILTRKRPIMQWGNGKGHKPEVHKI